MPQPVRHGLANQPVAERMDTEPDSPLLTLDDLRPIALWAAYCAERALPVFEAKAPDDTRPREAITAARAFGQGGARTTHLRRVGWAALAAAREIGDPAASAAARAACAAAGTAYTHPLATAHQINHILSPAAYGAHASALLAGNDPTIGEAEIRWAIENASPAVRHLVQRLSARAPSISPMGTLLSQLDAGLRR